MGKGARGGKRAAFSTASAPVRRRRIVVRPRGRLISTVQVRVGVSHDSVAEGNCVAVRRGGE
ncbi:MAG: hypothetical protein ACREYF_04885, partial [Gammaproteobacteria bacterium]